jgi:hypothetical protein
VTISFGRPIRVEREPGESKRAHQERVRGLIEAGLGAMEARAFAARRRPAGTDAA